MSRPFLTAEHESPIDSFDEKEEHWARRYAVKLWSYVVSKTKQTVRWYIEYFNSFIGAHYVVIVTAMFVLSWILYPIKNMTYTDCLFNAASMATGTGLNSLPGNEFYLYQTITIFIFVIATQPLFLNSSMVVLRLYLYEKRFRGINQIAKRQSKLRRSATRTAMMTRNESRGTRRPAQPPVIVLPQRGTDAASPVDQTSNETVVSPTSTPQGQLHQSDKSMRNLDVAFGDLPKPPHTTKRDYDTRDMFRSLNMMQNQHEHDTDEDEGPALVIRGPRDIEEDEARGIVPTVFESAARHRRGSRPDLGPDVEATAGAASGARFRRADTGVSEMSSRSRGTTTSRSQNMRANYLSWVPAVGRNSTFVNLTHEQKDELGGVEYRALKLLLWFIGGYFFGLLVLSWIFFVPWSYARKYYREQFYSEGYNPAWFGFFSGMSALCNLGFSLTPQSMTMFQTSAYVPLISAFFILCGDIALPIFLRFVLWIAFKVTPRFGQMHESLGFLLDHPRRCFLLLFPSNATWWLAFVVVLLNLIDLILFCILDLGNSALKSIPVNYRVMGGFFQAIATRTAGFNIFDLSTLHPAIQLSYIIMMYISVFPLAISIRQTNVYEEQTLGIFYEQTEEGEAREAGQNPLVTHMQRQLSYDMWYLALGTLIVCICEGGPMKRNEISFFAILFEVVSAYANVGMSLGYPNTSTSLSAQFNVPAKLVMILMMIRGRHRGLPYRVDRAILLHGETRDHRDGIQENRTKDVQELAPRETDNDYVWLNRVGTAATALRRTATTRLRPALTRISTQGRRKEPRPRPRAFSVDLGKINA